MANERTKCPLTDDQIKHMVNRFLAWKLPEDFTPDAGISFKPILRDGQPWPEVWPVGTNLLMAVQAEAMIRYMVDGIQHGGVCLWCGFSTTRSSLDELADAIYAHLGECDASPVPTLIRERDTALAESRKRGEEVVALKYELSRANTTCNDSYQIIVDTDREKHQLTRSVLALTETLREIADRGPRKRVELPSVHAYMTGALESADVMEDYAQAYRAWGDQINSDTARLVLDDTSATADQTVKRIEREALEKVFEILKEEGWIGKAWQRIEAILGEKEN